MLTLHYVEAGSNPTFPHREVFRKLGMKFDRERKQWYAVDSERTAQTACDTLGFGYVMERTVETLPPGPLPRGRAFGKGSDPRRRNKGYSVQQQSSVVQNGSAADESDSDMDADTKAAVSGDAATQLAAAIAAIAGQALDASAVKRLVAEATADLRAEIATLRGSAAPLRIVVERPEVEPRDCGVQHRNFPILLKACNARTPDGHRLNVWLVGPAGSGKTSAASEVSKALGLAFWSNGALASKYELLGFADANSHTHRTPFREAWEHGGVFLWDEIDGSDNNAVLAFNQGLANGVIAFPDGMVPRHVDCVIIAGANSANGSTANYNGRIRQDGAFLDRFVYLDWPLDEALERAIAPDADWCKRVQAVRATVAQRGVQGHLVTPRATLYGAALLAAGLDKATVETLVLRKALSDEQWAQVRGA